MRDEIRRQLTYTARWLEQGLADLSDQEAAARPQGLAPIVWQVGHMAYYDAWLVRWVTRGELLVPAEYEGLFRQGSTGDGPLPPLADVWAAFQRAHAGLLALADGDLEQPLDGGDEFAIVGGALFFMNTHRGYHIGKVFTLRGLLGKPLVS